MELCSKINALEADVFCIKTVSEQEQGAEPYPLSVSFDNWVKLQKRFPDSIDANLLSKIYQDFNKINIISEKLLIPTLCHGDFHPENFLLDNGKLLICDWQGICIGRGIGDVAFFMSRGIDMGITINRNKLIKKYQESLYKFTGIQVSIHDLHKDIAASELSVSFRFWAEYLQDSSLERIKKIYSAMDNCYTVLF